MFAAEFLIERLQEQVTLAPQLIENTEPGGSIEQILDKLKEGMNKANLVPQLRMVESGARRYTVKMQAALTEVEKLKPIFEQIALVSSAQYADGAQQQKAMERFKDTPKKIEAVCKAAIGHLEGAVKILDEGEKKDEHQAKLVGAK